MSNYFSPPPPPPDIILKCEAVETKVEVVIESQVEEYEVPEDGEESCLQFFNPCSNGEGEEEDVSLQQQQEEDPLSGYDMEGGAGVIYIENGEEEEEVTKVQPHYHPVTSTSAATSSLVHGQIHPYPLQIPRLYHKSAGRKRKHGEVAPSPKSELPVLTIEGMESIVKTFIDNCLSSRKDPRCRHQFYHTIHKVLNEAVLHQHVISPEEVDSYWIKFDEWASSSTSYRLGDHYMLQNKVRANDPDEDPPRISKPSRKKGKNKFQTSNPIRATRNMTHNLEQSVKKYVLNSNSRGIPLREDLKSRVEFYQTWHKAYGPRSELYLDFFWNALINRTADFYGDDQAPPPDIQQLIIVTPEILNNIPTLLTYSPQKQKTSVSTFLPSRLQPNPLPRPLKNHSILRSSIGSSATSSSSSSPKNLDMDRLVKICINNCIEAGKDPKATHKFYWTIHRSLETVQSLNLPLSEIDALWKKYDDWAELAYGKGQQFQLAKVAQLYSDVDELPPPIKRVLAKARPPELEGNLKYPENLRQMLEKTVRGFVVTKNIHVNDLRDDLKKRRYFLESYVHFMQPEWEEGILDHYWWRLLTDTLYSEEYQPKITQVGQKIVIHKRGADMSLPASLSPPPTPSTSIATQKKFYMDRLIQICINECIKTGKDPKATHKFYWSIHRSLETVSSLNLSKEEVDLLWKKYDDWADQAFWTRRMFQIDMSLNSEYFADVSELPPPPVKKARPPRPSCLNKQDGLRKWLEKVVRQLVLKRHSTVNNFREDLEARRGFLGCYVDFIPLKYDSDFVIDGYWRRLLRETVKDYKLYLELGNVVREKFRGEEQKMALELASMGSETDKRFNMDYLVKKVINQSVLLGVDPRSTHQFYWTIHRCLETSRELNPSHKTTSQHLDMIWGQYDDMARKAHNVKCVYSFPAMEFGKFYESAEELPPPPPPKPEKSQHSLMTPTRLFPSCPKSMAMKKFLDYKLKIILQASPTENEPKEWLKARRKFFLEYVQFVGEMGNQGMVANEFWRRLLNVEEGKRGGDDASGKKSMSTSSSSSSSKMEKVPCYDIDD